MFILERPVPGSAVAMVTVQVEWSASVMRDTMVGQNQKNHIKTTPQIIQITPLLLSSSGFIGKV